MNFVIGDIHGELDKLQLLLKNIFSIDSKPSFIFIGDYLDKGDDPFGTIKYLSRFSGTNECIFLRGNHEFLWEKLKDDNDESGVYLSKYGGKNTIYSIDKNLTLINAKQRLFSESGDFFHKLRAYHVTGDFVMTHSGIPPEFYKVSLENIPADKFLFNRYDFISTEQYYFHKKVIFGHTGFYSPFYDGFKIGIDTAACYLEPQPLTAFCIEDEFFIDSGKNRIKLSNIDRSCCPAIPRVKAWRQK
jgi:serine/threonine protein phosphatase 1